MGEQPVDRRAVLVAGATGTVGREVVRACAGSANLLALARDPSRARNALPDDVAIVEGDLRSRDDVGRALDGVEAAFYVSPHIPEEEECAALFSSACRERGTRLVFVGSHVDGASTLARWAMRKVVGVLMSPYRAKFRLSEAVRTSGADAVVLAPTNFAQNDELGWIRAGLLEEGVYRYPVGARGMNRLDVRDLGEIAARALLEAGFPAGGYSIAGPASLNGAQCAAAWARALGREVRYQEDSDGWESALRNELAGRKSEDFLSTWRAFAKYGVPTVPRVVATTTELLGRTPSSYQDYVDRTARSWLGAEPPRDNPGALPGP